MRSQVERLPDLEPRPEAERKLGLRILTAMKEKLEELEPFYLDGPQLIDIQHKPLDKARYALFERWLETHITPDFARAVSHHQGELANAVSEVVGLYQALADLKHGRPIPEDIRKKHKYDLAPDEFLFERGDTPHLTELPSEQEFKRRFKLDWIAAIDYSEGKSIRAFDPNDRDLIDFGYAEQDPAKREAFLHLVDRENFSENPPPGRIFDISEVIEQILNLDPYHGEGLTTKELLDAFDEANVRPATLEELLAYSEKYWCPENDPNRPRIPEEAEPVHSASVVYAFGSIYSYTVAGTDDRSLSCLVWRDNQRRLDGSDPRGTWGIHEKFLVFRKD